MPLKSAGLIFLFELVLSGILIMLGIKTWSIVLSLMVCMMAIGYYIGELYKEFWNVVLEESTIKMLSYEHWNDYSCS